MDESGATSGERNGKHFVVAVGASAGGIEAIRDMIAELPGDLDAPVVIAMHSEPGAKLANVLKFRSSLDIRTAQNGDVLECGTIYVVPGATHAFFRNGRLRLSEIVTDSGFRPSIDALFMTLAAEYGNRGIAVVLSGMLQDGMRGAQVVYDMGGRTVVQDPDEAGEESMPQSVIRNDHPSAVRTAAELGEWLNWTVGTNP